MVERYYPLLMSSGWMPQVCMCQGMCLHLIQLLYRPLC
jgi:hypothetical protein